MSFYNNKIERKRRMTPQCEAIYKALKVFPCIHFNQMRYLMPKYMSTRNNYELAIANYLVHDQFTNMHDNCVLSKEYAAADEEYVDTLWVAIDLFRDRPDDIYTALRTATKYTYPCTAAVFKDNAIRYNLLPISSAMDFAKIYTENEKYKESEWKDMTKYIIIMRNKDLFVEFNKTKPEFPFEVALLQGAYGEYPTIEYYGNAE